MRNVLRANLISNGRPANVKAKNYTATPSEAQIGNFYLHRSVLGRVAECVRPNLQKLQAFVPHILVGRALDQLLHLLHVRPCADFVVNQAAAIFHCRLKDLWGTRYINYLISTQ
jgi:hypothetical protein